MANIASVAGEIWFRSNLRYSSPSDFTVTLISASDRTFSAAISKETIAFPPLGKVAFLKFPIVDVDGNSEVFTPVFLNIMNGPGVVASDAINVQRGSDLSLSGALTDTTFSISGLLGEVTIPILNVGLRGEKGDTGDNAPVRTITASGVVTPLTTDGVLAIKKTVGAATTVNLPAVATRTRPLTIKDDKGDAATNSITIAAFGSELIDGSATYVIDSNWGAVTVRPNDTGTAWLLT